MYQKLVHTESVLLKFWESSDYLIVHSLIGHDGMSIIIVVFKWKINKVHIRLKYKTLVNLSAQTCRMSTKIQYTPPSFSMSVDQLCLLIIDMYLQKTHKFII